VSDVEEELTFEGVCERIAELADDLLGHHDQALAERVSELLDWIDVFHREGLGRLIEMIRSWRGEIFLEAVARDEICGAFLSAYDLGEAPDVEAESREAVEAALEEIRPYAHSHGGSIEVESIKDGVVRLKMLGSCDGCPSSAATLSYGVEEALRKHWSGFRRLELVDEATEPADADTTDAVPDPQPQLLQIRGFEGR
jgi:Fe-S cluster biogenesis protein NfuA